MKPINYIFILAFIFLGTYASAQSCDVDGFRYSNFEDIQIILDDNNCVSCHSDSKNEGNWSYETYEAFLKSGDCNKPTIIHGNASQSYFYGILTQSEDLCGESRDFHKIETKDLDQVETWINNGAPEFCMPLYADIRQVLDINGCQSCHNPIDNNSWHYSSYQDLIGNGTDQNCTDLKNVVSGNAISSLLFDKINNDAQVACGEEMLGTSGPLSYTEIANIRDWINGGLPETAATLPVVLSNFNISKSEMKVILNWTTEAEIGTDKFIIERSRTGKGFQVIGELPSSGGSSSMDYEYLDEQPELGENYYRLKILDLDGSYDYSNIRLTRLKSEVAEMSVHPNPVRSNDRLRVKWVPQEGQESTYLNIVDVNGQNLARKVIFEGTNYVRLPVLLEGVYYIIVEDYFGGFLLERVVIID